MFQLEDNQFSDYKIEFLIKLDYIYKSPEYITNKNVVFVSDVCDVSMLKG